MTILKFPDTIGKSVDLLKKTQLKRKEAEEKVKELKAEEDAIAVHITGELKRQKLTSCRGTLAQFTLTKRSVYQVDWDQLWPYILKKKLTTLVQKRLGTTAYQEMSQAGLVIPGVQVEELDDYSLTAVKAKE